MSQVFGKGIRCDICAAVFLSQPLERIGMTRARAREEDWAVSEELDFCPSIPHQPSKDAL